MKPDRGRWILAVALVAGFLCMLAGTASGVLGQEADRKQYAGKVRETYNFRFGKDQLFLPGTMQVEGDDFVPPGGLPPMAPGAPLERFPYSLLPGERKYPHQYQRHRVCAPL
jgi:hypothetical protein